MGKENKETVSSLEGVGISGLRRHGNTTRIVDNVIQQLFNGKRVKVEDHSGYFHANEMLLKLILMRLQSEHSGVKYDLNVSKMEIELIQ